MSTLPRLTEGCLLTLMLTIWLNTSQHHMVRHRLGREAPTRCAIESGEAYCWGYNAQGQLGIGSTASSSTPLAVDTNSALAGKKLTRITTGDEHSCALDSTGSAYCWGWNEYGQLGDGTTSTSNIPVAVDTSGVLADKHSREST
jgi:alpha-tubulin suppressor-like RCC1 family protein